MPAFNYKYPRPTSGKAQEGSFFKKEGTTDKSFFSAPVSDAPIQTKLTVGKAGDKYEQEADAMADRVVNRPAGGGADIQSREEGMVHRMEGEEEEAQAKFEIQRMEGEEEEEVQAKFEIQRMEGEEEEEVQAKFDLQRMEGEEEEEVQAKPELMRQNKEEDPLQAKAQDGKSGGGSLENSLAAQKGRGNSLPENVQTEMSQSFGHDFQNVKVHTDQSSVQMNKDLGAQAFTHGNDVYFNQGKYDPDSKSGKHLLAHELTHVVQQEKK